MKELVGFFCLLILGWLMALGMGAVFIYIACEIVKSVFEVV
jgi:hypothetical protein